MKNRKYDTVIVSGGSLDQEFAMNFIEEAQRTVQEDAQRTVQEAAQRTAQEADPENVHQKVRSLLLVAADKGLEFFLAAGVQPDLVIGDFDSLSAEGMEYLRMLEKDPAVEIIRLKPEKDDSDTQSAVTHVIARGAKEIAVLGATGSRVDHMLANTGLLLLGAAKNVPVTLIDPNNLITLIGSGTVLKRAEQFGTYVSFFPLGGTVHALTLEGFKYPLHGHDLQISESGLTVSNEIKEVTARITYTDGNLLMIMAKD